MTLPGGAELGTTKDPKALIKGEPSQVRANATRLSDEAKRVSDLADEVDGVTVAGWSGGVGKPAYDAARAGEQDKWKTYVDMLKKASTSLSSYAGALTTAQSRAADAIKKWQDGEDATAQAVTDYNHAVDAYNAYVCRPVTVPSYGSPTVPSMGPSQARAVRRPRRGAARRGGADPRGRTHRPRRGRHGRGRGARRAARGEGRDIVRSRRLGGGQGPEHRLGQLVQDVRRRQARHLRRR